MTLPWTNRLRLVVVISVSPLFLVPYGLNRLRRGSIANAMLFRTRQRATDVFARQTPGFRAGWRGRIALLGFFGNAKRAPRAQ